MGEMAEYYSNQGIGDTAYEDSMAADRDEAMRVLSILSEEGKRYWVQRDGTTVLITKMDDNHLVNTIRMLNRQAKKVKQVPARAFDRYVSLCEEAVRRGLEDRIGVL